VLSFNRELLNLQSFEQFNSVKKMELTREHFRAIIFHNFRRGLSRQECIDELKSLYGDQAPSYSTVKNWYNEFNRGRSSLNDEFREGRPKTSVVPENIDAVRELIMQDRHVTYREIEASLGISPTSIHSILHKHLTVKKVCCRWIPHNLTIAQKKARVDWCKEMLKKYDRGASKDVHKIVTGDESWIYAYEPETKQQSTVWVFEDEPNPTKVVRGRSTSKQMVACFFGKLVMWRLFRLSNEGRSILSGTPQFVCLKSSEKFEKQTREDESFFTMTTRALTHRLKPAPF